MNNLKTYRTNSGPARTAKQGGFTPTLRFLKSLRDENIKNMKRFCNKKTQHTSKPMHFYASKNKVCGFTLIEILVAVGVLLILIVMGTGALVQIVQYHRQTQVMQASMNDLNFVMESMSRHIRFGAEYGCVEGNSPCSHIYTHFERTTPVEYELVESSEGGYIQRTVGNTTQQITSPENINIETLEFHITGTDSNDDVHPYVTIVITGNVSTGANRETNFSLQTTVDQRFNEERTNI